MLKHGIAMLMYTYSDDALLTSLSISKNQDDFQVRMRSLAATSLLGGAQNNTSKMKKQTAGTMAMIRLLVKKAFQALAGPA